MLSSLALLLSAGPALAGGVGLIGTGGLHGDRVYYYKENSIGEFDQQTPMDEMNPNVGGGLEFVLGDKDYKINGFFRLYYLGDFPVVAPEGDYTYSLRTDSMRDLGVADVGVQFGVFGEPDAFQLCIIALIGSAVMTTDQTEFFEAEAGFGFTYTMARHVQLHAEIDGGVRYRKRILPTANLTAGVRYLFD